jgi:DNA topoisomerase I
MGTEPAHVGMKSSVGVSLDVVEAAAAARLRYVCDRTPGIERVRKGRGFAYRTSDGRPVRVLDTLRRIRALVIPPA